jgi:hypothetical protein
LLAAPIARYTERKEAVLATGDLVAELEDAFRKVEEQQRKFDLAKRAASANLKHAELEFAKLLDRVDEVTVNPRLKRCQAHR